MKKALIALGVALVALVAIGALATTPAPASTPIPTPHTVPTTPPGCLDDPIDPECPWLDEATLASTPTPAPTMHNCPQEGTWGTAVWTGDTTDADVALGTCSIVAAYAFDYRGDTLRWFSERPELNTLETLHNLDAVIALGGPPKPVVPEPTNIPIVGELPDDCDLTMVVRSAGQGHAHARTGLHTEPFEGTKTWTQMARAEEICFYCNGEFLVCADFPKKKGSDHRYTVEVVVTGNEYEILPRQHEYMLFDCGRRANGSIFMCRGYAGEKIPFNPTCPNNAWQWDERDPRGFWCEGYPKAVFKARRCQPGESPVEGKAYCLWRE